jgi:hypothetical protein
VVLSATTDLQHGLELMDSSQTGPSQLVVQALLGARISHIVLSDSAGLTITGPLIMTGFCGSGIIGTLRWGDLIFLNALLSDPNQMTIVKVNLLVGSAKFINSVLVANAFLIYVAQPNQVLSCAGTQMTATSSTSAVLNGNSWREISIGFAATSILNTNLVNHIDIDRCSFTGASRGYFNYFNAQVGAHGNLYIRNSVFDFQYKLNLRLAAGTHFNLTLVNCSLIMRATSSAAYLGIGNGIADVSSAVASLTNCTVTSASNFQFLGARLTSVNSSIYIQNHILLLSNPGDITLDRTQLISQTGNIDIFVNAGQLFIHTCKVSATGNVNITST